MVNELEERDLIAVKEVIASAELASIDYYDVSASRLDDENPDHTGEDNLTISVQYRSVEQGFGVRLLAEVVLPNGRARACVAGEYLLADGFDADERACQIFVNEVAVMTVYPYLREAMATATSRVFGEPLHLPIVQRGEIRVNLDGDDPAH
ncbi:MAG: hypothetical protein WC642_06440 [Nocardioides sp.]|jgi:hypothetical protein